VFRTWSLWDAKSPDCSCIGAVAGEDEQIGFRRRA
jgi:hypothetical protein